MLGWGVSVDGGDLVLVGDRVTGTVALGLAVRSGKAVRTIGLLQAVSQQQTVITTNSLTFLLFGDSKE
jgi:hypothetical protein